MLALATGGILVFLIFVDFYTGGAKPYLGILTYLIFPAFLIIGLLLMGATGPTNTRSRSRFVASFATP